MELAYSATWSSRRRRRSATTRPIPAGQTVLKYGYPIGVAPTEAARNNPSDPGSELRLLLVHGILHLLGYDHEEEDARTRMWERQERYSGVRAS